MKNENHGFSVLFLQGVEAAQRDDMVTSMVYEASARVKDPVNGCASEVHKLQKRIAELESQLGTKEAELKHMRAQYFNLALPLPAGSLDAQLPVHPTDNHMMHEEVDPLLSWWPLWEV
ncbi:hypothetical protein SUGI_0307330 [Cryptomeria japonica]|uniref:LOB domain-containing protein 1-like n=1 Tax=Cryptomeria japonica TaxID=3369 RepID=UPI002408E6BD|nr:LOB domain-containing protein 1-like [Cryptomeria japonica]GLJ17647.1 hypothetical protein SUGI_0307330 [Cryptomeria japonica]